MKIKFLFFSLVLIANVTSSQCNQTASNFGNNSSVPSYNINGDVNVIYNTDNSVTLNLASNFNTAPGPDVRAYLINSEGKTDSEIANSDISAFDRIAFGLVQPTGSQTFNMSIPSGFDISDFDKVFFYCLQFGAFWDFGSFTPFTPANCSVLSTEDNSLTQNISIFPNPASKQFKVRNELRIPISIAVYDVLGKKIQSIENTLLKNQTVSLSNLNSGVYLVEIKSDKQRIIKKLIKR